MQRESDFLKLHRSFVNDLEKTIVKQYQNQRFAIDGEKGTFEMKGLQRGKIVFANEEKTLHVPLEKVDLVVKTIDSEKAKLVTENDISAANHQTIDKLNDPKDDEKFLLLKEKDKELTNELNRQDVHEFEGKNLERAKEINKDFSDKINKNLENNLADIKGPFLIHSQIRGQLEVLNLLKNFSDKEIIKALKDAERQAKSENKSIEEVYSNNLQRSVNAHIQASKERTLEIAINTYETNKELRNDLRMIVSEINKNMGVLYQAKLEQKISPEEYNQLKERLDQQKSQIDVRFSKINQNEMIMNEQLKTDLNYHFPDLKTDKLSLNESIALATAAYTMTNEKTIQNLRDFSLEKNLKETIQAIDKTTKQVEFEIKEITEITVSR
jgi:hypothetical protein